MEKEIIEYLGEKIIGDIRNSILLNPELCLAISKMPYVDHIRSLVHNEDFKYLNLYIQANENSQKHLGFTLLQNIKNHAEIKKILKNIWLDAKDFQAKMNIMFRLLDYSDLEIKYKNQIFDFIVANWNNWVNAFLSWYCDGNKGLILEIMEKRLSDNRFPASKNWVYLLVASVSPENSKFTQLFNKFYSSNDPMLVKVKDFLIKNNSLIIKNL